MDIKEEFHKLTEFFVREVDYKNKEGVHLAYTLHKATMEEHYSIEKIMEELEHETGMSAYEIVMATEAGMEVESIYKTVYQSDGNEISLIDKLPVEKDEQEELMNHLLLEQLLQQLDEREKKLIHLRYYENVTQTEVAKQMGLSQVQVSRMEKKILLFMRHKAEI